MANASKKPVEKQPRTWQYLPPALKKKYKIHLLKVGVSHQEKIVEIIAAYTAGKLEIAGIK